MAKASTRPLMAGGRVKLELSDIESGETSAKTEDADPFAPLDKLYRMEKVREELTKIRNMFKVAKAEGAVTCQNWVTLFFEEHLAQAKLPSLVSWQTFFSIWVCCQKNTWKKLLVLI